MKIKLLISVIINTVLTFFVANSYNLIRHNKNFIILAILAFVIVNFLSGFIIPFIKNKRLAVCQHGTVLLSSFYISVIVSAIYQIFLAIYTTITFDFTYIFNLCLCIFTHFIVFWNGIICVYLTSIQLGLKIRIIGVICGMIPIANLVALFLILKTTTTECLFEAEKIKINTQRKKQKICSTKYPILMVHGVFFRDTQFLNYWGRIPNELEENGAKIFYGNHSSASSIADSAEELKKRINDILEKTGDEKVNIIAHSKGGLDCRYALAKLGISNKVASLTTINTPHNGCLFADYLLNKIPVAIKNKVANSYNSTLRKFGEESADFLSAVNNLTNSYCNELNCELSIPQGVYCQSVGSVLKKATNGKFPLNFSYHLVKHFSGENDGLVSESSFKWGEKYTLLKPTAKRGISHGDMIDLNRENIPGFDVREFYVELVHDLKERGL